MMRVSTAKKPPISTLDGYEIADSYEKDHQ